MIHKKNGPAAMVRVRLLEQVGSYDLAEIKSRTPICLPDRSATANLQNGGA
jgi:hypothetical protein